MSYGFGWGGDGVSTPWDEAIDGANRRHRMDERSRIRRMVEAINDRLCHHMTARNIDRLDRLIERCQAELDILNAELGL